MGNQLEESIIKAISGFDPDTSKGTLIEDARVIANSQQFKENEFPEAGISGRLGKVALMRNPEKSRVEESGVIMGSGYLLITNEQIKFFSLTESWGKKKIDKSYSWNFSEVSVAGIELKKLGLWLGDEKIIRFHTNMGELRFDRVVSNNVRYEDFIQILKGKNSPNNIQSSNANLLDELERLAKLRAQGILSDKEFELAKAKLLR